MRVRVIRRCLARSAGGVSNQSEGRVSVGMHSRMRGVV
jgi:hypothetical protein